MDKNYSLTVFTPTYNRLTTLATLYHSLLRQKDRDVFEWLVIDDGSTDGTEELVHNWICEHKIDIHYVKVENGGKPRAINKAVTLARSPYLFIVDSDDYVLDDTIDFLIRACASVAHDDSFVGVGGLQGKNDRTPRKKPLFSKYIDATNLERSKFGLNVDCNEVYKVDILKKYPFFVWPNELFTPESVVFNQIALDGYKVRWYNKIIVISEYLSDGMTKNSWNLMKNNPMGYAMLYNHQFKYIFSLREKFLTAIQMDAYVILGRNLTFLLRSNAPFWAFFSLPFGIILALRRHFQYKK